MDGRNTTLTYTVVILLENAHNRTYVRLSNVRSHPTPTVGGARLPVLRSQLSLEDTMRDVSIHDFVREPKSVVDSVSYGGSVRERRR